MTEEEYIELLGGPLDGSVLSLPRRGIMRYERSKGLFNYYVYEFRGRVGGSGRRVLEYQGVCTSLETIRR